MLLRILRFLVWAFVALGASDVFAHPIDCTPGYSDSRCVTPIRTGVITPPTCPSAPGYSTITPAVWAGYKWTQPTCSSYQAPPTCLDGYDQQTAPVWNGTSWVGLSCIPRAPAYIPPTVACRTAASSGTILVYSLWSTSKRYVATSQFTPYVPFFQITWGGAYRDWQWPTYTLGGYPADFMQAAMSYLRLPLSTQNTNTWYAATYTGPSFINDVGNTFNGYATLCSIDANGNVAGINQMPTAPSTSLNE